MLKLVEPDDLLVVGFSGHGVHLAGKSYLCPADARLDQPDSLVCLDRVHEQLARCRASLKLLIVDACRNDPRSPAERNLRGDQGTRSFAESLQRPPQGTLLLSSCAPGETAREDESLGPWRTSGLR